MGPATKWGLCALVVVCAIPVLMLVLLNLTSKRPANLGPAAGKLRVCPASPNCVCSCVQSDIHGIAPLVWKGAPQAGLERLVRIFKSFPRTVCEPIQDQSYLHVEFTSGIFRFVDDVEFLVDSEAEVIHVRSASRVGQSDLGVNRQRVEEIRRRFEAQD